MADPAEAPRRDPRDERAAMLLRVRQWWPQLDDIGTVAAADRLLDWLDMGAPMSEVTPARAPHHRMSEAGIAAIKQSWTPDRRARQAKLMRTMRLAGKGAGRKRKDAPETALTETAPAGEPDRKTVYVLPALVMAPEPPSAPPEAGPVPAKPRPPANGEAMPEWRKARLLLRRLGYEVKQFGPDVLLDGQHTSNEHLVELARREAPAEMAAG